MKVLLVDNFDSFTYNLYQYIGEVFGEVPTVVRNNEKDIDLNAYDVFVISPGPGAPWVEEDFGICKKIIETVTQPILGICLGHQGIVNTLGGRVEKADEPFHGRASEIIHDGTGLFERLPKPLLAVRYHSLIAREPLPKGLQVTARTEAGEIMAVAHEDRPLWGVQFHPESVYTEYGRQLLHNFKSLAEPYVRKRRSMDYARPPVYKSAQETTHLLPLKWRCQYRVIDNACSSEQVFQQLFAEDKYSFWLDSSALIKSESRFSFMGNIAGPQAFYFEYHLGDPVLKQFADGRTEAAQLHYEEFLGQHLHASVTGDVCLPFNFCGGFMGYQGYELKQVTEGLRNRYQSTLPDAAGFFVDRFIAFDHDSQKTYVVALSKSIADENSALQWIEATAQHIESLSNSDFRANKSYAQAKNSLRHQSATVEFELEDTKDAYLQKIQCCKDFIVEGESYEICLTNRIRAKLDIDPLAMYQVLREVNPAPRSVFIRTPAYSVLSSSPEKFVSVGRNKVVEAKPIKGTRKRGAEAVEDQNLFRDLKTSDKDRAENLMIADLLRNDLNRVCEVGSVWTPKLMEVESFTTVHQLVSTIRGRLRDGYNVVDLLKASFPPGSMTGAPKRRTLEIIDELEGSARGIYSGTIGYLSLNGAADLNVVIRSIIANGDELSIGVGGAITMLSDPEEEFAETLIKARALMSAVALYHSGDATGFEISAAGEVYDLQQIIDNPNDSAGESLQDEVNVLVEAKS